MLYYSIILDFYDNMLVGVVWWLMPLYFSYIMAASFIGVGNHRPVASHGHILSPNVVLSTPRHEHGSNSQL